MPGINPIGQITNARQVMNFNLTAQQAVRRQEDIPFNPNTIKHTNPSIPNPQKVITSLTRDIGTTKGSKLNLLL